MNDMDHPMDVSNLSFSDCGGGNGKEKPLYPHTTGRGFFIERGDNELHNIHAFYKSSALKRKD